MNFVTIAVEIAKRTEYGTKNSNSIFSIGMIKYQNGKKVDAFFSLLKPPELCILPNKKIESSRYTKEELIQSPTIAELWNDTIYPFIDNLPILSHRNSNLDFLLVNLDWFGVPSPILCYFDSYRLAMNVWPSLKHRHLPSIAEELGISYFYNNALDEAEFYGNMILAAAEKLHCSTLNDLLQKTNIDTKMIVKSSLNLWDSKLAKPLEEYNIEELEHLAVNIYEDGRHCRNTKEQIVDLIDDIFFERGRRLNENLEWTVENVNKLLKANDLLVSAAEKGHAQAQEVIKKLEIKKGENNDLLDYDIEIKLTPYISGYVDPEKDSSESFLFVLCEPLDEEYLLTCDADDDKYFDRSETWLEGLTDENNETLDCFKNKYISYAVHELWDAHWCFHDIMNINKVLIEIKIKHEKFLTSKIC